MSVNKRILLAVLSLIGTILFAAPMILVFAFAAVIFLSKYVSLAFCLLFAWHSAKLVEHFYQKSQENK